MLDASQALIDYTTRRLAEYEPAEDPLLVFETAGDSGTDSSTEDTARNVQAIDPRFTGALTRLRQRSTTYCVDRRPLSTSWPPRSRS